MRRFFRPLPTFFLFAALLLSALQSQAQQITLHAGAFEGHLAVSDEFTPAQVEMLREDLRNIEDLPELGPGSRLHQQVFQGAFSGETFLRWFLSRISQLVPAEKKELKGAHSDTTAYFRKLKSAKTKTKENAIFLAPMYFNTIRELVPDPELRAAVEKRESWRRFSILLHEARHAEGYDHVKCKNIVPALYDRLPVHVHLRDWAKGTLACDNIALGAYGIETLFQYQLRALLPSLYEGPRHFMEINYENAAPRIIDLAARKLLNEDLVGPMVPRSFADMVRYGDRLRVDAHLSANGLSADDSREGILAAIQAKRAEMIELLERAGADLMPFRNLIADEIVSTVFVTDFSEPFLRKLVTQYGIDPNHRNGKSKSHFNFPALFYTVMYGDTIRTKALLELGATPRIDEKNPSYLLTKIKRSRLPKKRKKELRDLILEKDPDLARFPDLASFEFEIKL